MPSQIRPTRQEVSDRFPMLGFTITTDGEGKRYEVAIASDAALFRPDAKTNRTRATFYTSRAAGLQLIERGEAVYVLPPEVLSRFAGQEKLYYVLATYSKAESTSPEFSPLPSEGSAYISLRGLTGRTLSRVRVLPSRQRAAAGYGNGSGAELEWGGDLAMPGTQPVDSRTSASAPSVSSNQPNGSGTPVPGTSQGLSAGGVHYDDGFDKSLWSRTHSARTVPGVSGGRSAAMQAGARSMGADYDVALIPQPDKLSCWAASMTMLVGFRRQQSLSPETLAQEVGRSLRTSYGWDMLEAVKDHFGFIDIQLPSNASLYYSPEQWQQWLNDYGPLWVTTVGAPSHAIIVSGLSGDLTPQGTTVSILNPWDTTQSFDSDEVDFHPFNPGRAYTQCFADFSADFGNLGLGNYGNWRVLFLPAGSAGATGQALSATNALNRSRSRAPARAQSGQSFSINWDEVEQIAQPTGNSCWATAGAMILGWRDRVCLSPETVAEIAGRTTASGVNASERRQLAVDLGLSYEAPQSYSIDGFRNLLENNGPLWVGVAIPNGHAIVVTGLYSDGAEDGSDTYVRITDPWDRVVGSPGAPGAYLNTHTTGSRYIMTWAAFVQEYEDRASSTGGTVNVQIAHAGGTGGRQPSRSGAAGYAMAASARNGATARPLVFDREDVDDAQRYGPAWRDLLTFATPASVVSAIQARDMHVQRFEDAIGDLNLDFYPVRVDRLPNGYASPADLLSYVRLNLNSFVDTSYSRFEPYAPGTDDVAWASGSPLGAVYKIIIPGDNAAVAGSLVENWRWRFTTLYTPDTGEHPVSGHREWGYQDVDGGGYRFYTRGADRSTSVVETALDAVTFGMADRLWQSYQAKLAGFINGAGGSATIEDRFSKRFKWSVVNILVRQQSAAQGLGLTRNGVGRALDDAAAIAADDAQGIEESIPDSPSDVPSAQSYTRAMSQSPEYPQASRFEPAAGVNYRTSSAQRAINRVVIHITDGGANINGTIGWFKNPNQRNGRGEPIHVSAHYVIGQDGEVVQMVPHNDVAWHARSANSDSIGIEHCANTRGLMPTDAQYCASAALVRWLCDTYSITIDRTHILGHSEADTRTSHSGCPNAVWDWGHFMDLVQTATCHARAQGQSLSANGSRAVTLPAPPAKVIGARALEAEISSAPSGTTIDVVRQPHGNITWALEQLHGFKHPNNSAPTPALEFRDAPQIRLSDWPYVDELDQGVWAWFALDWKFSGKSLGEVRIAPVDTRGAMLQGATRELHVEARIIDDTNLYPISNPTHAALQIRFQYRFKEAGGSECIAVTELRLYGDGTFDKSSRWEQS